MKDEKQYEQVGNIRIKEIKKKKTKKKNSSTTPLYIKILVWFMLIAMLVTSFGSLLYYFIYTLTK